MNKSTVVEFKNREQITDPLTEMLRTGAQDLIQRAVEAELQDLLNRHQDTLTEDGRAAVVRNGYLPERKLQTSIGPVSINMPKVRSRIGEPVTFRSALVPPPTSGKLAH